MKAKQRVKKDFNRQKNEAKFNRRDKRLIWKLRGYVSTIEYWIVGAFSFPIAIIIWMLTGDFWKGLAFYFVCILYHFSGNFRGFVFTFRKFARMVFNKNV